VEDKEVVDGEEGDDKTEPEGIPLKKRVKSVDNDCEKKKEMKKGEDPIKHDPRLQSLQINLAYRWSLVGI
jgi:hypothetical protein